MGRNPDRQIDKTHLSLDMAEDRGILHRDYIAHCFRWSHVAKHLQKMYKDAFVLDVGCGKEMPLAKTLYSNRLIPRRYVGVDVNRFDIPEMLMGKKIPVTIWPETDFCALTIEDLDGELADVATCFEVLEHVTPEHARRICLKIRGAIKPFEGRAFISTPCWNGSAAGNHINEMTYHALEALLEDCGFKIEGVHGTFASIRDYEPLLGPRNVTDMPLKMDGETVLVPTFRKAFEQLREYYDSNALSVLFAPMFPEHSRNCIWTLSTNPDLIAQTSTVQGSKMFDLQERPWSQHPLWRELSGLEDSLARTLMGDPKEDDKSDGRDQPVEVYHGEKEEGDV